MRTESVAALLVLGLGAPAASAAPSCVPSGTNVVCTFSTVAAESFTVPPGVTQVTIAAFGAQAGGRPPFSFGGLGGEGQATIAVSPGQPLQVNVGGAGGNAGSALPNGGFNGGGAGGAGSGLSSGAGGGGASDVRTGSFALPERVVVGGGGGAGGTFNGGGGGGTNGGTQTTGSDPAVHGSGGTQSAGGAGGTLSGQDSGDSGASGSGGAGGDQPVNAGGSGGGGGYFGGGGGAASSGGNRGSGGGGSGFGTTVNSAVRAGNGLVTITYAGGQLRVVKALSPVGDPGKFNLQVDGITEAADVGDGGNTGLETVDPGTRSVGETAGTATSLADYTSAIVCKDNDGAGATVASAAGAGPLDVPVASGAQIACTITDTRQTGQLRVVKSLVPASDPGRFDLQIDGATQTADVGDGGNTGLQTLNTGTHTVAETAGTATSLADYTSAIVCKDNDGAGATVASAASAGPLDVPVTNAAQIACTITNTRQTGQLRVVKSLSPTSDPGRFNLQIDGITEAANVGDGGNTGLRTLNTGAHTVRETAGTSASLSAYTSAIVCKDNDGSGATVASAEGPGPLTVTLADNVQIACTITNTRIAVPVPDAPAAPPPDPVPPAPPAAPDGDGDGVSDALDNCALTNPDQRDTDAAGVGDLCDPDDDQDGLSDRIEARLGSDPRDQDTDDDGLSDLREDKNANGRRNRGETDACRRDTDRDRIQDGTETGTTKPVATREIPGTDVRRFRPDRDPSTRTNPRRRDTDRDGVTDGREDANRNGRVDRGETNPRS